MTFRATGQASYAGDLKCWKQMVEKERDAGQTHSDRYAILNKTGVSFVNKSLQIKKTNRFNQVKPKPGVVGGSVFATVDLRPKLTHSKTVYGNLRAAQADGLYQKGYTVDHPVHYSDPPYQMIKPSYRPHATIGMANHLDLKHQYSFKAFGQPQIERKSVDINNTAFRQTMCSDTPYYRKQIGQAINMKHALVDPSHTFQSKQVTKARTRYGVFNLKPKGAEKDSKSLAHERRVTYDFSGKALVRLTEQRDMNGGVNPEEVDPLTQYKATKDANQAYFNEARRSTSFEERVKVSIKHTSRERHPEIHERGAFKAYTQFKNENSPYIQNNQLSVFGNQVKNLRALQKQSNGKRAQSAVLTSSSQKSFGQNSGSVEVIKINSGKGKRLLSKYRILKQMVDNERSASSLLKDEVKNLTSKLETDSKRLRTLLN